MKSCRVTFLSRTGITIGPFVISNYQYTTNLARKHTRDKDGKTIYNFPNGNVQFTDVDDRVHCIDLGQIMHTLIEKVDLLPSA